MVLQFWGRIKGVYVKREDNLTACVFEQVRVTQEKDRKTYKGRNNDIDWRGDGEKGEVNV